jgi:hypothetical protein
MFYAYAFFCMVGGDGTESARVIVDTGSVVESSGFRDLVEVVHYTI